MILFPGGNEQKKPPRYMQNITSHFLCETERERRERESKKKGSQAVTTGMASLSVKIAHFLSLITEKNADKYVSSKKMCTSCNVRMYRGVTKAAAATTTTKNHLLFLCGIACEEGMHM